MKVIVKKHLNVRVGSPSVNAPCFRYLTPGSELEVDGKLYKGDSYDNNDKWLRDDAGNFYWSGGVEGFTNGISEDPVPLPISKKWWIENFKIPSIWIHAKGKGIKIGILDTGIQLDHPDLQATIVKSQNFVSKDQSANDQDGHGTHVSGIIASQGKAIYGVAPESSLYVGKIMQDCFGGGLSLTTIIEGLDWLIEENVDIVSLSLELFQDLPEVKQRIEKLFSNNTIIVSAAGNAGQLNRPVNVFPACYPQVVSVGSMDQLFRRDVISNRSIHLDVLAPGKEIESTFIGSTYKKLTGTSQAAPFVTGVFSLLLSYLKSKNKTIENTKAVDAILTTAQDYGLRGFDDESGNGIVSPFDAFEKIQKQIS